MISSIHCTVRDCWRVSCAVLVLGLPLPAMAGLITVDVSAGLGERYFAAEGGGTALVDGELVRVGTFPAAFDFAGAGSDIATLNAGFTEFATFTVTTLFTEGGRFSGSLQADDAGFAGEKIYLWAFDTTTDAPPNAGFTDVNRHGIFTSDDSAWVFPDSTNPPTTTIVSTNEANMAFADGLISGSGGTGFLAVPEPSGFFLSLIPFSMLWSASRRRRL